MMPREVPEWRGPRESTPPPPRVRLRILDRFGGKCANCGVGIVGSFAVDHIVALCNSGTNAEHNMQPLCRNCHSAKTAQDVAEKAKVAAVRRKAHGAKYSRQGFRGWRAFDGTPRWKKDKP